MKALTIIFALALLPACGEASTDGYASRLSAIENCLDNASGGRILKESEAAAAVKRCGREMDVYTRFVIEEMFDREFSADDQEMMDFLEVHQNALRKFALRKLTTGEGDWK